MRFFEILVLVSEIKVIAYTMKHVKNENAFSLCRATKRQKPKRPFNVFKGTPENSLVQTLYIALTLSFYNNNPIHEH